MEKMEKESKEIMNDFNHHHIRSSWNPTRLLMRGPLTDKKIEKYAKRGWYSEEFREARRGLMQRKALKRDGAFFIRSDGSKVYSPK